MYKHKKEDIYFAFYISLVKEFSRKKQKKKKRFIFL